MRTNSIHRIAITTETALEMKGLEMTQTYMHQPYFETLSTDPEVHTNLEFKDYRLTERDITISQRLLVGTELNDVSIVDKFLKLLPSSHLTLDSMGFYDFDTDQEYSILGYAKAIGADRVVAYLMFLGLTSDYVNHAAGLH